MTPRTVSLCLVVLALAVPASAFAQPRGNAIEATVNGVEGVQDRNHLVDDHHDFRAIAGIAGQWSSAVHTGNRAAEMAADVSLAKWIEGELAENAVEGVQSRSERARSRHERNRSRREAVAPGGGNDHRDFRDDRRDLRNDRRDAAAVHVDRRLTRRISAELAAMQPAFTAGTASRDMYARKAALLRQLSRLARTEVSRDHREIREDRRERREDRRERFEDRR